MKHWAFFFVKLFIVTCLKCLFHLVYKIISTFFCKLWTNFNDKEIKFKVQILNGQAIFSLFMACIFLRLPCFTFFFFIFSNLLAYVYQNSVLKIFPWHCTVAECWSIFLSIKVLDPNSHYPTVHCAKPVRQTINIFIFFSPLSCFYQNFSFFSSFHCSFPAYLDPDTW